MTARKPLSKRTSKARNLPLDEEVKSALPLKKDHNFSKSPRGRDKIPGASKRVSDKSPKGKGPLRKRPLEVRKGEGEASKSKRMCTCDHPRIFPEDSVSQSNGPKPLLATDRKQPAPFTNELPPPQKRDKPITHEEALKGTVEPVRVYADGVFDIFHPGHARVLMQAKNAFPNTYLIAGVTNDKMTHELKGKTVCSECERYDALRHCRYVDEVLTDAPWIITPEFMDEHQIDFVAHDDVPYGSGDTEDIYKPIKEMGRFVTSQRTPGVSTSDIIARIVKDYDLYLKRNLERGYTTKEMNVGFLKAREVKLKEAMNNWKLGERGKDIFSGFMSLFGRDGRISEFFHDQKERLKRVFSPEQGEGDKEMVVGDAESPEDMAVSTSDQGSSPPTPPPTTSLLQLEGLERLSS